jgi:hypothetical protein
MGRTEELEQQVLNLTRVIDEMKGRIVRLEGGEAGRAEGDPARKSRRNFLRLGAAAALGAVGMAAGKVIPASAANGGNFTLGQANLAESPTTLTGDGASGAPTPVLEAAANGTTWVPGTTGTFAGPLQGVGTSTGAIEGVDGWAGGAQAFGVYGLTDSGTGVVGEANTGIGLHARGSGRIRQDPQSVAPSYTPNDFEQVRDPSGNLWISQAGGVWRQVAIMHLFPDPRRIYDGFAQPSAPGTYGPIDATMKAPTAGGGLSGVPAGAQAALCAVQSYQAGVMTIFPDGTADPGLASWASTANGLLNLFYMFVPLSSAGKFKIHTYFTGQKFFDVWGFLL